jgi:hypothetical protein
MVTDRESTPCLSNLRLNYTTTLFQLQTSWNVEPSLKKVGEYVRIWKEAGDIFQDTIAGRDWGKHRMILRIAGKTAEIQTDAFQTQVSNVTTPVCCWVDDMSLNVWMQGNYKLT